MISSLSLLLPLLLLLLSPLFFLSLYSAPIPHCSFTDGHNQLHDYSLLAGTNHGNDYVVNTVNEAHPYQYTFGLCREIWSNEVCLLKNSSMTICQFDLNQTEPYDIANWMPNVSPPIITSIAGPNDTSQGITFTYTDPGSGNRHGAIEVYCPNTNPNAPPLNVINVIEVNGDEDFHLFQMSLPEVCPPMLMGRGCQVNGVDYTAALADIPDLMFTSNAFQEPGPDPVPYNYWLSICRPLTNPECINALGQYVSICQTAVQGGNPKAYYDIADWRSNGVGVEITYIDELPINGLHFEWTEFGSGQRLGEYNLFCPLTTLPHPSLQNLTANFLQYGLLDHVHGFNYTTVAACPPGTIFPGSSSSSSTGGNINPPSSSSSSSSYVYNPQGDDGPGSSSLSGGWIFIIIIVCVSFVYCVGGCGWNKYNGASGPQETIPQYGIWAGLFSLSKDGCRFTWRKLSQCCGGRARGTSSSRLVGAGYEDIESINH